MKLLIIRPQPGADASAARARAAGFEPIILPFFEIRPRPWDVPDPANYDALLVTSANALRHAGGGLARLTGLPVHAVGAHSAKAARDAGFTLASEGQSNAEAALTSAAKAGHGRLLWLAGEDHGALSIPDGMSVDVKISYASEPLDLDEKAKAVVASCGLVALHSPRAALRFAQMVDERALPRAHYSLAAFSPAIAASVGTGWRAIAIAKHPEDSALLSAVQSAAKVAAGDSKMGESD